MATGNGHPKHVILIVERDQSVRDLQTYFLGKEGYVVEFADDGDVALQRAKAAKPTLIVTEILVPKIDGLALCRRLKDDPATQDIPVVVFSILGAGARALEAGAKAFLRKPFVETKFVATVQELIAAQSPASKEPQWAS